MWLINLSKTVAAAISIAVLFWAFPALAAGTLPLAMAQQIDANGQPLAGCQVQFFVAGTASAPQNSYQDYALSLPNPQILTCDVTGRVPMFWLADGLVHVRMTDASGGGGINGGAIVDTTMQVLGPSSGSGGGGNTVDPTTIASTGDLKWRLDTSTITGWVRINGLTIGNTTSGATERANADTQSLFIYIWTNFSHPSGNVICPVVGGLGASALADFNANKQITLEDARARTLFALDAMGNSALGGFTGVAFTKGSATTGGSNAGLNATTLSLLQTPTGITVGNAAQAFTTALPGYVPYGGSASTAISISNGTGLAYIVPVNNGAGSFQYTNSIGWTASISATSNNTGGQPFPSVPSALLGTLFWKL